MVDIILQGNDAYIRDLKARMEKYKVSQNALAREMEKNPTQVSRWFTDNPDRKVKPELDTIMLIEQALERLRKRKARH